MPVHPRRNHISIHRPCRRSPTCRHLRREFCHRWLLLLCHVRDGECPVDAMRASIRSRTTGYVGDLYVEILGNLDFNGYRPQLSVYIRGAINEADRTEGRYCKGS
ncbi:hypothetical protein NE237_000872 [Protea cynaroides]|uniref:Uncharacterized protein n=1 Tax=Protea cynaroides TaxID=273540 RepID=A0A9Q0KSY2_9MAGN|nr:hypothetical protein NE237_000872 [Protea cynaroides]